MPKRRRRLRVPQQIARGTLDHALTMLLWKTYRLDTARIAAIIGLHESKIANTIHREKKRERAALRRKPRRAKPPRRIKVGPGETLGEIAQRECAGDWRLLFELNRAVIVGEQRRRGIEPKDIPAIIGPRGNSLLPPVEAHLIFPGTELEIPQDGRDDPRSDQGSRRKARRGPVGGYVLAAS